MRNQLYIVILCTLTFVTLSLTSCRPKGILSSREMREVLVDLHKTDGIMQIKSSRSMGYEEKDLYYAQVLAKHNVTQAQFDSSLVWYTAHPQFFNKIYPKVLKELEAEEEAFNELYAEELSADRNQPSAGSDLLQPNGFGQRAMGDAKRLWQLVAQMAEAIPDG